MEFHLATMAMTKVDTVKKAKTRPSLRNIAASALVAFTLTACQTSNLGVDPGSDQGTTPVLQPNPSGEVFGNGKIRVTLLLPKTAPGNGAAVAQEIRNGALMALNDFGQNVIQLVIKDTVGQTAEAQAKAGEAINEGSSMIIGPLFNTSVSAASAMAQPANRPMIAFSSDTSVARRGVYLLSYTPQDDVRRILSYAASQGRKSLVAFVPNGTYGSIVSATVKQLSSSLGFVSAQVFTYERSQESLQKTVGDAAAAIEGADTLYIPEGGGIPNGITAILARLRIPISDKQILGSGQWESVKVSDPRLANALYPGRDVTKFANFASRYQTTYGTQPGVNAATGYDAITLVAELFRRHQQNATKPVIIENKNGFAGVNGIFRFQSNGVAERGLAIYKVVNGKGQLLEPAPTSFGFRR